MKINSSLAAFNPSRAQRTAATQSMRIALADAHAELEDAADYAEAFAQCFFAFGSVRFAAAIACKELDQAQAGRELAAKRAAARLNARN